mmetsp:Transcript_14632/g.23820  ORF Transcript_14632/g.23820 Transcript_14632/m.23820 type:complete len:152 (-) Transcript_14632:142-597(-)
MYRSYSLGQSLPNKKNSVGYEDSILEAASCPAQFAPEFKEYGRVVLSLFTLKMSRDVDRHVIALLGREQFEEIVQHCKRLYNNGKKVVVGRSPTKTRKIACESIEPYLAEINKTLAIQNKPVFICLVSRYSNVFSCHPAYYLSFQKAALSS